jgi:hypothetical protein
MTNIFTSETLWLFLLVTKEDVEANHVYDIAYGVAALESKGIDTENIKLVIDGNTKDILEHLSHFTKNEYNIEKSLNLKQIIEKDNHKNIVVFVSCHGKLIGLDGINPCDMFDALASSTLVENIIIYFGQCYAGVFKHANININNKVLMIGAADLNSSVSYSFCKNAWCINLFLYNVFNWFKEPVDVDGDKRYTILD